MASISRMYASALLTPVGGWHTLNTGGTWYWQPDGTLRAIEDPFASLMKQLFAEVPFRLPVGAQGRDTAVQLPDDFFNCRIEVKKGIAMLAAPDNGPHRHYTAANE